MIAQNKTSSVCLFGFRIQSVSDHTRVGMRTVLTVREITDRLFLVAAEGVANSLDASDLQAPVAL